LAYQPVMSLCQSLVAICTLKLARSRGKLKAFFI